MNCPPSNFAIHERRASHAGAHGSFGGDPPVSSPNTLTFGSAPPHFRAATVRERCAWYCEHRSLTVAALKDCSDSPRAINAPESTPTYSSAQGSGQGRSSNGQKEYLHSHPLPAYRERERPFGRPKLSCTPHSGFTLLELIVALAMTAAIAASLYASLRSVFIARASAEAAIEPARTAELAMGFLRNDFQNAMLTSGTLATSFQATSNGGAADVIFFTTADSPEHPNANGEIKQVELTVQKQANTGDTILLRRVSRNLLSQTQVTPDEEVLCRGVSGLRVRYFTGDAWIDSWDSTQEQNLLPAAVEVTLALERPGGGGQTRTLRYVRVFPISCSTVSSTNPAGGIGGLQ